VVFTNGCFDLMHVGHTSYLQTAKDLGDLLVVGVNSDESSEALNKAPEPAIVRGSAAEVVAASVASTMSSCSMNRTPIA